ncbi:MAG: hypothetical protein QFX40_08090 [Archaeoglobales archaeon]|nr:hypothetical protein [Archaeoglobales archaeon]
MKAKVVKINLVVYMPIHEKVSNYIIKRRSREILMKIVEEVKNYERPDLKEIRSCKT